MNQNFPEAYFSGKFFIFIVVSRVLFLISNVPPMGKSLKAFALLCHYRGSLDPRVPDRIAGSRRLEIRLTAEELNEKINFSLRYG